MSMVLKASVDGMKQQAEEMKIEIQNVKKELKKIDEIVRNTKSYWVGDASNEHQKRYNDVKGCNDKLVKELEGYPKKLLEMTGVYEEGLEETIGLTNLLSENIIS